MSEDTQVQEQDVAGLDDAALKQILAEDTTSDKAEKPESPPTGETERPEVKKEEAGEPDPTKAELEKLRKKVDEQRRFIDRQGTEVGELRKYRESYMQLIERKKALEAQAVERFVENPSQFLDERDQINRQIAETQQAEQVAAARKVMADNMEYARKNMPDLDAYKETMASIFRESGDREEMIQGFIKNPFAFPQPFVQSVYLAAKFRKQAEDTAKKMEELTQKQQNVLDNVEKAARAKPLTNQTGGSLATGKRTIHATQLPELSDDDLRELIKQGQI